MNYRLYATKQVTNAFLARKIILALLTILLCKITKIIKKNHKSSYSGLIFSFTENFTPEKKL